MAGNSSRGLIPFKNYIQRDGYPFDFPAVYSVGGAGSVPPLPVPPSGNPYFQWNVDTQKFEPIPGSPADPNRSTP